MSSKKDFEAAARAIRCAADDTRAQAQPGTAAEGIQRVANYLAAVYADQNPRFNRARFLTACGVAS